MDLSGRHSKSNAACFDVLPMLILLISRRIPIPTHCCERYMLPWPWMREPNPWNSHSKLETELTLPCSSTVLKVLIHVRWFDFYACHARSPCQVSDRALAESGIKDYNHEPFLCDHIVMYLYGLLLVQLMPGSCYGGQKATDRLLTKVSECVDQMPRNIEIAQGSQQGTIKVSWMDIASARAKSNGIDLKCRITLYESTCKGKRDEWFAQESE